jgi:hypothetical protein
VQVRGCYAFVGYLGAIRAVHLELPCLLLLHHHHQGVHHISAGARLVEHRVCALHRMPISCKVPVVCAVLTVVHTSQQCILAKPSIQLRHLQFYVVFPDSLHA